MGVGIDRIGRSLSATSRFVRYKILIILTQLFKFCADGGFAIELTGLTNEQNLDYSILLSLRFFRNLIHYVPGISMSTQTPPSDRSSRVGYKVEIASNPNKLIRAQF